VADSEILKYSARWPSDADDLAIELSAIAQGGKWVGSEGQECGLGLFEHFMEARRLAWPDRYRHAWTDLMYTHFLENIVTILMGAGSCVAGHTRLLNPVTGQQTPIEELCRKGIRPMVMTLEGPKLAEIPFVKGFTGLLEIRLADGRVFTASPKHRVLTESGFLTVDTLRVGRRLLAYGESRQDSSSGSGPLTPLADVCHWWRTTPDFQSDCRPGFRFCGERPHPFEEIDQVPFPSPIGVRTHRRHTSLCADGLVRKPEYSHAGLSFFRPSTLGVLLPGSHAGTSAMPHSSSGRFRHDADSFRQLSRFSSMTHHPVTYVAQASDFSRTEKGIEKPYAQYGVRSIPISSIKSVGEDFYYDLEVPGPRHYFAEGTIHHNTQKTSHASEFVLIDYWAHPNDTLVLISTTTVDKLDMAVYGEIKMLMAKARERYSWLPGNVIESKRAISTDNIQVDSSRDIRKGIVGRACYVGKSWVGLGVFAGIKQARIRFLADELQFMQPTFLDCLPNMFQSADLDAAGDPDIKVIGSGNPKHDPYDQLSMAAEPVDGWPSVDGNRKTASWPIKFHRGQCLNLVGTDSPNFDVPEGVRPPYPRLISRNSIKLVAKRWTEDSLQYWTQCVGIMKMNMLGKRVLTVAQCEAHGAFGPVVWRDDKQTRIGWLDPAWGGDAADRCMWGWLDFGFDTEGREIISFGEHSDIPILVATKISPDDQIANFVYRDSLRLGIDPNNIFYGSTGRGTTGAAFAKVFGREVPVALAEGDKPTTRPVRADWLIYDEKTKIKRPKRADEEYGRFNAEMWFAVRNVVECDQMRNFPKEAAREFSMREYRPTRAGKTELEGKDETRERMGISPDLADGVSFGVEGARQRGFIVGHAGYRVIEAQGDEGDYFDTEAKEYQEAIQSGLLSHTEL
jgi:hypothetical protein